MPQYDADVFHRMVLVNVQVAARPEFQVKSTVSRKKFKHMVEEPDAGRNGVPAPTVEVEAQADIRFARPAVDRCGARFHANHPVEE